MLEASWPMTRESITALAPGWLTFTTFPCPMLKLCQFTIAEPEAWLMFMVVSFELTVTRPCTTLAPVGSGAARSPAGEKRVAAATRIVAILCSAPTFRNVLFLFIFDASLCVLLLILNLSMPTPPLELCLQ